MSSSTSIRVKAPLVHHFTHEGSGGSPHRSHFKGISVPGSKKKGFSGHDALHSIQVLNVSPLMTAKFLEVHFASV
jgi:hypothetical protein